jgi:large subunit ribosomal protein L6e
MRLSKSQVYKKRAGYKHRPVVAAQATNADTTTTKQIGGEKNGSTRVVSSQKAPRWYPAEDVAKPLRTRKTQRATKLRASITPGTVLILLAGRFRGKHVVFLKQLPSGLLLVTGPYKVNGVPLRRVDQAYVIATSTTVDVSGVQIDDKICDGYFKAEKAKKKKGTEEEFFNQQKEKTPLAAERVADQKAVDGPLLSAIAQVPQLSGYLKSTFSLGKGQAPHAIKF